MWVDQPIPRCADHPPTSSFGVQAGAGRGMPVGERGSDQASGLWGCPPDAGTLSVPQRDRALCPVSGCQARFLRCDRSWAVR